MQQQAGCTDQQAFGALKGFAINGNPSSLNVDDLGLLFEACYVVGKVESHLRFVDGKQSAIGR